MARGRHTEDFAMPRLHAKLARLAPIFLLLLTAAAPAAQAQSSAFDSYYRPFEARLAAGDEIGKIGQEIEAGFNDTIITSPPACAPIPPGGIPGVTSLGYYFLSEILSPGIGTNDPTCGFELGCFLDQVAGTVHDHGTLVIDRECRVRRTLTLPDRYEIAGVGLDGAGRLTFELPNGARALRFKPAAPGVSEIRHTQIRDLVVGNLNCCGQIGIDLSNSSLVSIDKVRLAGFAVGIGGTVAYVNTISGSNLSNNGIAIRQGYDTTTWQMRENTISFSRLYGITFDTTTRASVVTGSVLESNPFGAVYFDGFGNTVQTTWFETNGAATGLIAIRTPATASHAKVLTSLFSNNDILDAGFASQRCYNSAVGPLIPDTCP